MKSIKQSLAESSQQTAFSGLTRATVQHVQDVAHLHAQCISQGFLSTLGIQFLGVLYNAMLSHTGTSVQVYIIGDSVVGFTSATEDVGKMYKWILKRYTPQLAWAARNKIFRFSHLKRICETLLYPHNLKSPYLPPAEQLSIAVNPNLQFLRLGPKLIQGSFEFLRSRGIAQVRTTCAEGLGSNRLVQEMGFELVHVINHHGRRMNVYVAKLN